MERKKKDIDIDRKNYILNLKIDIGIYFSLYLFMNIYIMSICDILLTFLKYERHINININHK